MTAPSWVCARPPKRGDVEAALAALKEHCEPQTVEAMERLIMAKIVEQRAVEQHDGHTAITPKPC
jgi:hypothetical protein